MYTTLHVFKIYSNSSIFQNWPIVVTIIFSHLWPKVGYGLLLWHRAVILLNMGCLLSITAVAKYQFLSDRFLVASLASFPLKPVFVFSVISNPFLLIPNVTSDLKPCHYSPTYVSRVQRTLGPPVLVNIRGRIWLDDAFNPQQKPPFGITAEIFLLNVQIRLWTKSTAHRSISELGHGLQRVISKAI